MAHWAKIENGIVTQVVVAEDEYVEAGHLGNSKEWIKTSYNTRGGVHYNPETGLPSADQTKALRKNYAVVGMLYNAESDAFTYSQPYPSWILDETTGFWNPPIDYPEDQGQGNPPKFYHWNESNQSWVLEEGMH